MAKLIEADEQTNWKKMLVVRLSSSINSLLALRMSMAATAWKYLGQVTQGYWWQHYFH
jgi:hypothetical protein